MKPCVFLATPCYGGISYGTLKGILSAMGNQFPVHVLPRKPSSLLACEFNAYYCYALNNREKLELTHFAMIHADVQPKGNWLWQMVREALIHEADILSAVIPIKSPIGVTSTAVYTPSTQHFRRLTLKECYDIGHKTFGVKDVKLASGEDALAVNTGLILIDLRKDWCEKLHFQILDRIVRLPDGEFAERTCPEDWYLSVQAAKLGLRVYATLEVPVVHCGDCDYSNESPWGFDADPHYDPPTDSNIEDKEDG